MKELKSLDQLIKILFTKALPANIMAGFFVFPPLQ